MKEFLLLIVIFASTALAFREGISTLEFLTCALITLAGFVSLFAVIAVRNRRESGGIRGYCNIHDHRPLGDEGCPMCRTAQEPPSPR